MELLSHTIVIWLSLFETAKLFSKVVLSFFLFPLARLKSSDCSFFLPILGTVSLFKFQPFILVGMQCYLIWF